MTIEELKKYLDVMIAAGLADKDTKVKIHEAREVVGVRRISTWNIGSQSHMEDPYVQLLLDSAPTG
jgi:hypothetical protein